MASRIKAVDSWQLSVIGYRLSVISKLPITDYRLPITTYHLPLTYYLLLVAIFVIIGVQPSFCNEYSSLLIKNSYNFAEKLFDDGDYYRAITEYKRYLCFNRGRGDVDSANYKIALSYKNLSEFDDAEKYFKIVLRNGKEQNQLKAKSQLMIARMHIQQKYFSLANIELNDVYQNSDDVNLKYEALYWSGFNYLEQGKWNIAKEKFVEITKSCNDSTLLKNSSELCIHSENGNDLPHKSPILAFLMSSIIPGSGQLYVGNKKSAFYAFIVNGAFGYFTIRSLIKENYSQSAIIFLFGWSRYYIGNREKAREQAVDFNERQREKYLKGIEKLYGSP